MEKIKEGSAVITVEEGVFFNTRMQELRDMSVEFLKVLGPKQARLLDSTAATGVRAIRYKKEAKIADITLLDINEKAAHNAKANIKLNRLKLPVLNKSIQDFASMATVKFDVIDLDPFGSPQPYMHDIMKISKDGTILMITATDTAVLCGAHANACYKIYGSKPLHDELCKEAGIRILLNYISKTAAQFNYGIEPIFTVSSQHYMRVFIRLKYGSLEAVESVKSNGFGVHCRKCHAFSVSKGMVPIIKDKCTNCGSEVETFGPVWLSQLYDKKITQKMLQNKKMNKQAAKIVVTINNELDTPLFYSIPRITKSMHVGATSHYVVIERLRSMGFKATATQFDENGIKTNADIRDVIKALKAQ